jgi:hypothetical protein
VLRVDGGARFCAGAPPQAFASEAIPRTVLLYLRESIQVGSLIYDHVIQYPLWY